MLAFAFDRDWTVDVNPHPRRDAVPLAWVRHLAHDTDHCVYAIGNQTLAAEAAIPGVVDIVGRHPDDWDDWLGEKQPDGRYEQFPKRRERLHLIEDLHPEAEEYIVVDDLDLSDVEGWKHYHAWEFVPAVESGEIDPALPWTDDLIADGGVSIGAEISPTEDEQVRLFLEDHDNAPGYRLTYDANGQERTQICWDVTPVERSFERPAAKSVVWCTPLSPGENAITVPAGSIQELQVITPPAEAYTAVAETPAEQATGLRRVAAVDPEAVDVSDVLSVIESGSPVAAQEGFKALAVLAASRQEACTPALPILRSSLERESCEYHATLLQTVRAIAVASPPDVAPMIDAIEPFLTSDQAELQYEANRCLSAVADHDPTDIVPTVPTLAQVIDERGQGFTYALHALACVSRVDVDAFASASDTLAGCLADDDLPDNAVLNAMAALGRLVSEYPDAGVPAIEDVVASLDSENAIRRSNAAGILGDISRVHTMDIKPYVTDLVPLLTDEDRYCRINASAAVSRIAEDFPATVEPYVDVLVTMLDDEEAPVRRHACRALGYLQADSAIEDLRVSAQNDSDDGVREAASWAVHEMREE